jgi:hypothetical protein
MATQPVQSAFGTDPESTAANEKWKQAYDQLLKSLDARQEKPFFDPVWLAAAQGFLTPKKTGNFFEGLGTVAGNVAKAQEAEQNRALETAKARLDLAGMGVQQANQQATARELARRAGIGGEPSGEPAGTPSGGFSGAPSGGLAGAPSGILSGAPSGVLSGNLSGQPAPSGAPSAPSPFGDMEPIGQYPVNPNLIKTPQEFYKRAMQGGERDLAAIEKGWTSYQKDFLAPKFEGGNVYDPTTGFMYSKNTGETGTASFMTRDGGTYSIPKSAVIEHQRLLSDARKNSDNPEVWNKVESFEDFWRKGPTRTSAVPRPELLARPYSIEAQEQASVAPPPSTRPAVQLAAQPVAQTNAQPYGGLISAEEKERRKQQEASDLAVRQARATAEAQAEVAQGAKIAGENVEDVRKTIVEIKKTARGQANIADQMAKLVTEYPNAIGTASKPGFLSAGIKLLESGANIGGESAKASALEEAVATLKGTSEELSARRVMMGLAAEYLFSLRALQKGQGTITDFETRVLQSIGPSLQDDAKTARFKAHVMKMHAEAEIDRVNEFNDWQKKNKGLGWRDYLGSTDHDKFATNYDKKLGQAYDTYLGRKPQQTSAQPSKPASNPALDFARSLK